MKDLVAGLQFLGIYCLLGLALFAGAKRWHGFLVNLAAQHDIPTRRRIAARWYLLVGPLMLIFIMGAWFYSVTLIGGLIHDHPPAGLITPAALICAVLPMFIWWFRRTKVLEQLGYGQRIAKPR